jgi:hypothetical protein
MILLQVVETGTHLNAIGEALLAQGGLLGCMLELAIKLLANASELRLQTRRNEKGYQEMLESIWRSPVSPNWL